MAISQVGLASGRVNAAVLSYVPDTWPALLTGDLIVLYCTASLATPPAISAAAPGGAPYSLGADITGGTVRTARLSRFVASDGEAAPTISHAVAALGGCAGIVLRAADPTTPFDVAETTASTTVTATNVTLPNLTTVTALAWLLVGYAARSTAPPYPNLTSGANYTEQVERANDGGSGAGTSTSASTRTGNPVAVGTYGGDVFSHDIVGGARQVVIHTAIRPAPTPAAAGFRRRPRPSWRRRHSGLWTPPAADRPLLLHAA